MNAMTLYVKNELLIDHLHRTIQLIKRVNFTFHPMIAFIDSKDKLGVLENIKTDDCPSGEEMVVRYEKKLDRKLKSKKIKSYCISYEVIVQRENRKQESKAIAFKIRNSNELEPSFLYYAYRLNKNKEMLVTDIWTENNNMMV
jgi:hypothetical protein